MKDTFTWIGPKQTQELKRRLNAAGDTARLEVRGEGEKMALRVVNPDAEAFGPDDPPDINSAHVCPVNCP